jgi:starvation-inducible DNA-binding protein
MIADLVKGQEAVVWTARKVFPVADNSADDPTTDLLTQGMQTHEKTAWMLRAMLE